jgi:hypothetical protein
MARGSGCERRVWEHPERSSLVALLMALNVASHGGDAATA